MEARSNRYHLDFNWLWSKGRKIHHNKTGDKTAVLRKHANFLRCNKLKQENSAEQETSERMFCGPCECAL